MLNKILIGLKSMLNDEKGQGMVEYGLILALIAVIVIGALTGLGGKIKTLFENIANSL